MAKRYFYFSLSALGVAGTNAGLRIADLWDRVLDLTQHADLEDRFETVQALHFSSLAFTGAAAALLMLILLRLPDAQFMLFSATGFLFAAIFALFVAWIALPEYPSGFEPAVIGLPLLILIGAFLFAISKQGMIGYYWLRRRYGDAASLLVLLVIAYTLPAYSVWILWTR